MIEDVPKRFQRSPITTVAAIGWPYRLTLLMGVTLIGSFLSVLLHVTSVVGGSLWLGVVVAGAVGLGALMARVARPPFGVAAIPGLFALGLGGYLLSIPDLYAAIVSLELLVDTIALLLGDMSLLQLFRADRWAILMAPAPVYGTWYLLLRRRFVQSVWIGGAALLFVVLTGDASETVALVGATSALGVLGFGTLDRLDGTREQLLDLGLLLALVVVLTRVTRPLFGQLFPRSSGTGSRNGSGGTTVPALEENLIAPSGRLDIRGSVSLSPTARFTVTADEPGRWHVASYDRFTGRGWVRTGVATPYREPLPAPFGRTRTLEQRFTAASAVAAMPAAWQPVRVDDAFADRTRVTDLGGLQVTRAFDPGESYSVTSERPTWTPRQLRTVGDEVTDAVRRRYLQLPTDTPDRVGQLAADLTREATTRFDRALLVQRWLTTTKGYSLNISRPSGDLADAFIFEMSRGYCVYFATAMIVMLRTLDVPARMVVGYTTGEAAGDGRWEIRGLHSHAWVQAYFDQYGWVSFDPTPADARRAARARRLVEEGLVPGGDPTGDPGGDSTSTPTPTTEPDRSSREDPQPSSPPTTAITGRPTPELFEASQTNGSVGPTPAGDSTARTRRALFTGLSDVDRLTLFAGMAGAFIGVQRLGLLAQLHRFLRLRWQSPTDAPQRDIDRALERLEWLLARQHRPREPSETRRAYFASLDGVDDDRLRRILDEYEQARYRGAPSAERASEVIDLVDAYRRDHHSLAASLWPSRWRER